MSAREMAVVGELVLNNGMYNGNRIISAEYIHDMLRPYLKLGERFGYMNYGYLWYKPFDDREVYAAIGDSGNIIYVNKDMNVSVGMTGTFKPRIFDRVDFIEQKVLSVIFRERAHAAGHRLVNGRNRGQVPGRLLANDRNKKLVLSWS